MSETLTAPAGAPGKMKDYWKKWLRRFLMLLAPSFVIFFTTVFIGPLDIITTNQAYLTFTAGDLLGTCTWVMLLCTVVAAAVLAFVPGRAHWAVFGVLVAIGVMLYVQAMFLDGSIVTLDGSGFDWHDIAGEARVNIIIWIAVIVVLGALITIFPEIGKYVGLIACLAVVMGQAVGLITVWTPDNDDTPNYQLDGSDMYTVSSDENIIVITLDQFNPLIFEEQLEADPTLYDTFKDFIYYDNMSSNYSFTFPSLMCLLTHNFLDTTIPTREAVYNAWHSEIAQNFYDMMHDAGYSVELYMEANYASLGAENMLGKVDNVVEAGDLIITGEFFQFVVDMSLYRYFPIMMKNNVYVSTGGILDLSAYEGCGKLTINYDFLSTMEDKGGLSLADGQKMFKWYHLAGAHFPYVVDYDGYECEEDEYDRATALHGYLMMVKEYLEQLKENGVYDNANIIISADHGYFECFQAVCMVKPAGQTQDEMVTSSAPVSQEDIMATILSFIGADYSDYGTTVFDWNEGDHRLRTTRVWGYMSNYPTVEWIGNLDQWDAEANGANRYNVFGVFTYDGDRDTILQKERYWYYYGVADDIEPLYDSFY